MSRDQCLAPVGNGEDRVGAPSGIRRLPPEAFTARRGSPPQIGGDSVGLSPLVAGRAITDRDFRVLCEMIHRLSGIHLAPEKRALLVGRLNRRLRLLGLASFRDYIALLQSGNNTDETEHMLNCICTNETHFFREPQQFAFLENTVYPGWAECVARGERSRHIKVWSAACSTGEEPYSIAMSILERFPPQAGWSLEILATDLSTSALTTAVSAEWLIGKAEEIPASLLKHFMLKGTGRKEGWMAAGPELRAVVRFKRLNLAGPDYPNERDFDLIFCRNVIIYFDAQTKAHVVRKLLGHLAPRGFLLLGHSEGIIGLDAKVQCHVPAVYSLRARGECAPEGAWLSVGDQDTGEC